MQGKLIITDLPGKLSVPWFNAIWHITDNRIVVRIGTSQEALYRLEVLMRVEAWVD
ncbi:hypothetical protein D3C79_940360 [compost metagenome]